MNPNFYRTNEEYSARLRDTDPRQFQSVSILCGTRSFYQKYAETLARQTIKGGAILDIGCGVGQTVREWADKGFQAHGIDVSETSIAMAQKLAGNFQVYDGTTLPFPDQSFDAVGTFNVLEHVSDPIAFLDEMNRVLRPGGRILISSPNFLRVIGWRDYHLHMRGLGQKLRNLITLLSHLRAQAKNPHDVRFETLTPVTRANPMPDDDAIVATNALDIRHYLRTRHYRHIRVSCVDRPIPLALEKILDATFLRFLMLNSFVTAQKAAV